MDQHVMGQKCCAELHCSSVSHSRHHAQREAQHHRIFRLRTALPGAAMPQPAAAAGRRLMVVSCPQACAHKAPQNNPKGNMKSIRPCSLGHSLRVFS